MDGKLFPYLKKFKQKATGPNTIEYKIGEIFGEIENKIKSGYNLREIIDYIDELRFRSQSEKHELSHLYEAKIKNMGNAGRNGGEYYTPRPLIRAIVRVVKPKVGEKIYDGAVGSAGFLCEAFEYLKTKPDGSHAGSYFSHCNLRLVQSICKVTGSSAYPRGVIAANNAPPWYKSCTAQALLKGAGTAALDAIGILPEGGTAAFSLFHGAAGVSNGINIQQRAAFAAGIISTAAAGSDLQGPQESTLSTTVTGLQATVDGFGIAKGLIEDIPVAGQAIAIGATALDLVSTGLAVAKCY